MSRAQRRERTDERSETGATSVQLRWMCPYCGVGEHGKPATESAKDDATSALRAHIESEQGSGHGPRGDRPDEDDRALGHHVIAFDAA